MSSHEHSRFKIVTKNQHIYKHGANEFAYINPNIPAINNMQEAIDYLFSVVYPASKGAVATPADLPTGVDTPNIGDVTPSVGDIRFVTDDGDGKAAVYKFAQTDGEVAADWDKIMDVDWGISNVVAELQDKTLPFYMLKQGATDYDLTTELALTGKDGGQSLYGGDLANQHLTLFANNGDAVGNTGYVQTGDSVRPYTDNAFVLGTATERWSDLRSVLATIGTLGFSASVITSSTGTIGFDNENLTTTGNIDGAIITAATNLVVDDTTDQLTFGIGSITDTTGAISFGDENLTTTGTLASGTHTIGTLVLAAASITDTTGTISFGNETLSTTGTVSGGIGSFGSVAVDNLRLDGNTLDVTDLNGNLILAASGTGVVNVTFPMTTIGQTVTGTLDVTGQLDVDNLTLNGNIVTSDTGIINFGDHIVPTVDTTFDLGTGIERFKDLYLANSVKDNTDTFLVSELMDLRSANWRDSGRTQAVVAGDALFWSGSQWLASKPDTEIAHADLGGLATGDAGHTQFALLAGRAGGQTLDGGTLTTQTLSLRNNAVDDNGIDIAATSIAANADAVTDLGTGALQFKDLYMFGQAYELRVENVVEANFATEQNAAKAGRLLFSTDTKYAAVDIGGTYVKLNNKGLNLLYTDVELGSAVTVSAYVDDARNCIWQLCDTANNEEIMAVEIQKSATQVTIVNDVALPAGNYRLIGIQVN